MMKTKSVLLLCEGVDDVLTGANTVGGGIQVQMSFWATMFVGRGWNTFALTNGEFRNINGITFLPKKKNLLDRCKLSIVHDFFIILSSIVKSKADVVVYRGASRSCHFIALLCRLFRTKFVFFAAHDTDFLIGSEIVSGSKHNVRLYRNSIHNINYIVTQNSIQAQRLKDNYGKDSLVIPNIWPCQNQIMDGKKKYDVIWVANICRWKRVEWLLHLAAKMPDFKFAVVGGVYNYGEDYYEEIKSEAASLSNLDFLGACPFQEVNSLVAQSRVLMCTSEYEGFPNTFLQAWAADVPVVSTVNPNGVVTNYGLGLLAENEQEIFLATSRLMDDEKLYRQYKDNIQRYFREHHNAETALDILLSYIA